MATIDTSRCLPLRAWFCSVVLSTSGCGYGVNGNTPAFTEAPDIVQQPANDSVPMGLSATYSVTVVGTSPQYQWSKDGVILSGATGSSYVTPPTKFADDGSMFSVMVTNSAGTATSSAASLTVTARAPAAGDLRFAQVDAVSTVNGYGSASDSSTMLPARGALDFRSSLGTPLWVGTSDCSVSVTSNMPSCTWAFSVVPLPDSLSGHGLLAGYASDTYSNVQYDLLDPNWPNIGNGISPASSNSVATSLDLEPASQLFAVSWLQVPSNQQSSFNLVQNTVALDGLPAAAMQEGLNSRVITAISNNGGEITYLSYSWSADPSTVYDTQVSIASPANARTAAAALAAQGYIITATGLADNAGDVALVGTRVQGDSMPRPFMAAQGPAVQTMMQQGFATVGVIIDSTESDPYTYLGER